MRKPSATVFLRGRAVGHRLRDSGFRHEVPTFIGRNDDIRPSEVVHFIHPRV